MREALEGTPLLEKFAALDVSDSDDPELGKKIAALQARNYQEHPRSRRWCPVGLVHGARRQGIGRLRRVESAAGLTMWHQEEKFRRTKQ
jgi:hypothetical protein